MKLWHYTDINRSVGSGKSTLIQALRGETVTHRGFITMGSTDSIAFCAQTPWLVNKSIQKNILGTSLFNGPWYKKVLTACALFEDLKNYPAGDRTLVGSKGITLSGGQKQRIVSIYRILMFSHADSKGTCKSRIFEEANHAFG